MIDLVPCNRFDARLSLQTCVKRYRLGQKRPSHRGAAMSAAKVSATGCRGCPQGRERSEACCDA